MNSNFRVVITMAVCITVLSVAGDAATMYGGLGGQNGVSTANGSLVTVSTANGAVTVIGQPSGVSLISGLTFTSNGNLWGSTQNGGGNPPSGTVPPPVTTSNLVQINPITGAEISSVLINANGTPISIADLATQPGTDTIFGIQSPNDANFTGTANLYTISTAGAAMLVGNTGVFFGAIAFAPNGTLYMTSADLNATGQSSNCAGADQLNCALNTVNPSTAAILTSLSVPDFYAALGISPTGVIWAGNGAGDMGGPGVGQFFDGVSILNPTTGAATFVGNTGTNFVGDIAFQEAAPEPSSLALFGIGMALLAARRLRRGVKI